MKKKIPFSLDYKEKIESGEVSVVTKDGNSVRIICWDANTGDRPIVGLVSIKGNYDQVYFYNEDGRLPIGDDGDDLYLLVEDELTEFEETLKCIVNGFGADEMTDEGAKNIGKRLLNIARKEIAKEKVAQLKDTEAYNMGLAEGAAEALKDMPKWERATEDLQIGCLVWDERRNFHLYMDRVSKGELYISMADILRLPGSPKEREE